jgi:3-polyprenyl-4-hydroxybenzoate decarboxylase
MLDKPEPRSDTGATRHPRLDLQQHLADLEAAGLLVRIDRPINKDTELNPLVRWQFIGGVPEEQRRAFLFTNVIDSKGKRYDIPVVVGALASSPEIYAKGMDLPVDEIGDAWMRAIGNPISPVAVKEAPCQEVVIDGDALRAPDGGLCRSRRRASMPRRISRPRCA